MFWFLISCLITMPPASPFLGEDITSIYHIYFKGQEEGSFTFPNGEVVEHSEDSKDRTIMLMGSSAQKISVRLKPAVIHKSTQTDPVLLAGDVSRKRREKKEHKMPENPYLQAAPTSTFPSPLLGRRKAFVKWENKDSSQKIKEEHHSCKPSYQELEQVHAWWNKFCFTQQYRQVVDGWGSGWVGRCHFTPL